MGSAAKPVVCIVTPGTRTANNGNWRTAARWAAMLRRDCKVIVQSEWDGAPCDVLIALHARRSAASIRAYRSARPHGPLAVVLTGTDLYRDLPESAEAQDSLDAADRIVVLQDDALRLLREPWRREAEVVFQSAASLAPARKPRGRLDAVAVGHLREEKDPRTLFAAMRRIPRDAPLTLRHIGAPLDAALADAARELAGQDGRYRYTGPLPHGLTRAAIKAAHVLVHPSIMEGGANVIVEAITAGTPVIASRMSGNVGMLGADYPGYFEVGDAAGLAGQLVRASREPGHLARLRAACNARRHLFSPAAESRSMRRVVRALLGTAGR